MNTSFDHIRYDVPMPRVARISLARADARNAQNAQLLYELNDAFSLAASDDDVRCIVLCADGPHFSAGHDLRDTSAIDVLDSRDPVGTWCGYHAAGVEGVMSQEKELFLGLSERWRNLPKPSIAAVQGKAISGGLMLVWPCDLIVAAEDAQFLDITVEMGIPGAEFFHHPWELPSRIAKEMLFASRSVGAHEAYRLGMVNHVVPVAELMERTLELASRVASRPSLALRLAKESVNAAQDAQGRASSMAIAFAHHQLGHSHYQQLHGTMIDPEFLARPAARAGQASEHAP
ncbi:enoyl-CoA hydratase [Dactylosporangium sp. CA-233914]|uniref:enoyl-CoA hydratase n=1 Tax=Dactylosporangium sp. CA-233914 TaxID=3239934 RepID=UPI003D8BE167